MSSDTYMSDPKAKTYSGIIEGLQIVSRNDPDKPFPIHAEHDVIYVGGEHIAKDSEEGKRLDALGFHWDTEGWAYFT